MKKENIFLKILLTMLITLLFVNCNDGFTGLGDGDNNRKKADKSTRGMIDSSKYTDFTVIENDARTISKERILDELGGRVYKNINSTIKINRNDNTIELITDNGFYNEKQNVQMYAKFSLDVKAASSDCLYIRRDVKQKGILLIDNISLVDEQIPDLSICLPLYGYSRERIEVSPVMNGFIIMPSGTYWVNK